jgi:hypothetical protein
MRRSISGRSRAAGRKALARSAAHDDQFGLQAQDLQEVSLRQVGQRGHGPRLHLADPGHQHAVRMHAAPDPQRCGSWRLMTLTPAAVSGWNFMRG